MRTIGIDYSMTSPSICVHYGEEWSIRNCQFYFLTDRPKLEGKTNQFNGTLHPIHSCEEQRYDNISNWAMSIIQPVDANRIVLEGYSFGSTGRVFHIAENIGLLKHKMWEAKFKFDVIAPTAIKKFATGKGNANKEKMQTGCFYRLVVTINGVSLAPLMLHTILQCSRIHCDRFELEPISNHLVERRDID